MRFALAGVLLALAVPGTAAAAACPDGTLASVATLRAQHEHQQAFGVRDTGSPAQARYVAWLERRLRRIGGVRLRSQPLQVRRWTASTASLSTGGTALEVASAVQGSASATVTAPVVRLAAGTPITAAVRDRILVRDRPLRGQRDEEATLRDAAAQGARGVVFALDAPYERVRGWYRPYEGVTWPLPAVTVGSAEAAALTDGATATLTVAGRARAASTRVLRATLPGTGRRRVVITSHTDGVNALWDNGPIAMLAIAEHLSRLPRACRPPIELVFTTAHLFQTRASAHDVAAQLDREYPRGRLKAVLVLEHLGARDPLFVGVSASPALLRAVRAARIEDAVVAAGLDTPDPGRVPATCNFGGEGNAYHRRLLPTVAAIAGPPELFMPAAGLEAVDVPLMRRQTVAFAGLVRAIGRMDAGAADGDVSELRRRRAEGARTCAKTR